MRLHRITLRHFRGVTYREVPIPEEGVTVIEGANEIGKSSLVEAVDLIFDMPHTSGDGRVKAVQPVHADVGPEVEVEATVGPYHVVYWKRWLRQSQATLRVLAPEPRQYTGREAHDRMGEILDECIDRALWKALRYQQGREAQQADVKESRSLLAALDAAAAGGGSADAGEAEDLWSRVGKERERYFTSTGRLTAERTQRDDAVKAARERVVRLVGELDQIEEAAERHRRLQLELGQVAGDLAEQRKVAGERERELGALQQERLQVETLAAGLERAAAAAAKAAAAAQTRLALVERVRAAEEALARLTAEAEEAAPGLEAARTAVAAARGRRDHAREALRLAEEAFRLADQDLEHLRDRFSLEVLGERQARVQEAERQQSEALSFLEGCRIDAGKMEEIEQAFLAAAKARALLDAEAAAVRVEALAATELQVDGRNRSLAVGEVLEQAVAGSLEITLPLQVRLTIKSGAGTRDLEERAGEARQHLHDLCAAAGVSGDDLLTKAREQERRRRSAEQEREQAARLLADNLRDLTPQSLAEMIDRTRQRALDYQAHRSAPSPLPEDRDAAQAARDQAEEHRQLCRAAFEQTDAEWETADQARHRLEDDARERSVHVQIAEQAAGDAARDLAEARASAPDDQVAADRVATEAAAESARAAHRAALAGLEARNPEQVEALAENARRVLAGLEARKQEVEVELAGLKGLLGSRGEAGLHDQLDAARSDLTRLEGEKERIDRRAAAAALLHRVLGEHRDAARRAYVEPFRRQMERLGRIVFGPDLAITLDPTSLSIKDRTLDGKTVPYNSLSVGAKEQLSLLGRLACALLVSHPGSADAGVPLIIDDALGNSDPERLERLGAVLAMAGRQTQVVVLTCLPDRYRHVGSAHVIRLAASGPEAGGEAPEAAGDEGPGEVGPAAPSAGPGGDEAGWEARVLECLGVATAPLGKSEIIGQTGLPEGLWQTTINSLLEQGRVVREGAKRGARYRVA